MKAGAKRKYPQELIETAKKMKKDGEYSIRRIEKLLGIPNGVLRYYLIPGERARVAESTRLWTKRNPERKKASDRKWRKDNPEKWKKLTKAARHRWYWSMSKEKRKEHNRKHYLRGLELKKNK